jgi:hypothetical protein
MRPELDVNGQALRTVWLCHIGRVKHEGNRSSEELIIEYYVQKWKAKSKGLLLS